MGQREEPRDAELGLEVIVNLVVALVVIGFVALMVIGFVWLGAFMSRVSKSRDPDYTVAITGVAGLDQLAARVGIRPTLLSPVFNLTVRIDNSGNTLYRGCVHGLSAAVVSYGDAPLGRGSVPPFCAEEGEVRERAATAWGVDVALPRFLRERLAGELERGEAAADVQVTTPAHCRCCGDRVLVCSQAKIGGDPAPCRVEEVYPRPAPAAASSSAGSAFRGLVASKFCTTC